MSYWTKINARIELSVSDDIDVFMESLTQEAPKITGSEGNARIIILLNRYDEPFSEITIKIFGNLRDRTKEDTEIEYNELIQWLNNNSCMVRQAVCLLR